MGPIFKPRGRRHSETRKRDAALKKLLSSYLDFMNYSAARRAGLYFALKTIRIQQHPSLSRCQSARCDRTAWLNRGKRDITHSLVRYPACARVQFSSKT